MKNKRILPLLIFIILSWYQSKAQTPRYLYNPRIIVKQGATLSQLKNPFAGGFELPQFSALDLNMDSVLDIMIFDRGTKKFYTFLNDRIPNTVSYTYAPQYEIKLPSYCISFCLSYDYNNDGKMDLYMELSGLILQYRNTSTTTLSFAIPDTLYATAGDPFAFNVFCPSTNIPSFNDIDNDGDMDILSWDPLGFTITLYKNWRQELGLSKNQWKYKLADECWGKFFLSNAISLGYKCGMAYVNGDNYNPPPLQPQEEAHQGSTLLTFDADDDGDYEALLGDIYYDYLYYLKNGKKEFNYGKDTMIFSDSLYPSSAQQMSVLNFPAAYFLDVDNDGKRDIILAPNDGSGASKNKNQIHLYKNVGTDKKPVFNLIQKNFLTGTIIDFGGTSAPTFADIDGDGDEDLFIASSGDASQTLNAHDILIYYKNTGTLLNPIFELQDTNFLNLSSKNYSGIKPCFGDLNGDLLIDLLLGDANGTLKYYTNTSVAGTLSFTENTTTFASFSGPNYSAPFLVDYNRDGKLDLFLGNIDGTVSYLQNTGTKNTPIFTKQVDSVGKICVRSVDDSRSFYGDGMSVPVVADLNKDGQWDLLLGGKYGLYRYLNIENHLDDSLTLLDTVVTFALQQLASSKFTGLYVSPAIAQLDSDAILDIMTGNNGGGITVFSTYEFKGRFGIHSRAIASNSLSIIPNPALNTITLEGLEDEIYSIHLIDATGKKIKDEAPHHSRKPMVDISQLLPGVYFVMVVSKNGDTYTGTFVKR